MNRFGRGSNPSNSLFGGSFPTNPLRLSVHWSFRDSCKPRKTPIPLNLLRNAPFDSSSIVGCNAILQSYTHNETKRKNGNIEKSFKVVKNSIEEWNVLHGLKRRNDAFVRFAGRKSTWGRKQIITGMWIGGNVETFRGYCNDRPTILVDSNRIRRVSAGIPREKAAYRWIWRVLFRRI